MAFSFTKCKRALGDCLNSIKSETPDCQYYPQSFS
jgi:hypothetical protein